MTATTTIDKAGPRRSVKQHSMSRDRSWALRWSYFFLVLFAIFFLTPPIYMVITSLKPMAEIRLGNILALPASPRIVTLRGFRLERAAAC